MNFTDKRLWDKKHRLKLWELAALAALCAALCAGTWAQGRLGSLSGALVRLHVVAVSDEPAEQALKLRVRDAVLDYLSPLLEPAADAEEAKAILAANLRGVAIAAQGAAEGRPLSVSLQRERFPTRHYGAFSLPAGEYEALRVVLGPGEGHNWWCVVFPPLCLSAAGTEELASAMSEEDLKLISDGEGYELRFKLVELWGRLMGALK